MKLTLSLIITVLCLALPTSAGAVTFTLLDSPGQVIQPFQSWGDRAKVPTVAEVVELRFDGVDDRCGARARGCTSAGAAVIWLRPYAPDARAALLHELGHRYDYSMPEWKRVTFGKIMRDARPWRDLANSLHEQFAEAYRSCAKNRFTPASAYYYGYDPTTRQHRRACKLIRQPG